MTRPKSHRDRRPPTAGSTGGFTLVELLVAIAVTSLLSIAIYALFSSTSEAMSEADSLVNAVNRARFATEQLRSDLRNAGSFGTPDSREDPWVKPDLGTVGNSRRVVGIASYGSGAAGNRNYTNTSGENWQNEDGILRNARLQSPNTNDNLNLRPSFDGFVLFGAYDLPGTFEVMNTRNSARAGTIYATQRGLIKLRRNNPFSTTLGTRNFSQQSAANPILRPHDGGPNNALSNAILRIQGNKGYFHFTGISEATYDNSTDNAVSVSDGGSGHIDLTFGSQVYQQRDDSSVNEGIGLEPSNNQSAGRAYPASVLDVFWYHVIRDPKDPRNFMLVRERLDGTDVIQALGEDDNWTNFQPSNNRAYGANDYIIIAEHLVDFQVWFDCAPEGGDGTIQNATWNQGWQTPMEMNSLPTSGQISYNCMDPGDPDPGRARVAHARLTVRTSSERSGLKHQASGFPDPQDTGNPTMQTFDLRPNLEGAAAVHTTQIDVELTNFAMRNVTQ